MEHEVPPSRKDKSKPMKPKNKRCTTLEKIYTLLISIYLLFTMLNIHAANQYEAYHYDLDHIKMHHLSSFTNHHVDYKKRLRDVWMKSKKGRKAYKGKVMKDDHEEQQPQPLPQQRILHKDVLQTIAYKKLRPYGADHVWLDIIQNGEKIMKQNNYKDHLVVVEVGAQNEIQSLLAARSQFHIYCVEPSPKSFAYIHKSIVKELKNEKDGGNNIKQYLHLYNVAAGSVSGGTLDFYSTGGTGDHVGEIDMWNMKRGSMPDDWPEEKRGEMVKVPSIQLDDIIYHNKVQPTVLEGLESHGVRGSGDAAHVIDNVFALKVDTQGFEPSVFAGLKKSIEAHKIQYIMTEYWPKGIGLMADRLDDPCDVVVPMLDTLVNAGYTLYALPTQGHPSAWDFSPTIFHHVANWRTRPLDDYKADCQHFLDFEKEFPNPKYHMGYWSDILAVAPGSEPFVPKHKPKKPSN